MHDHRQLNSIIILKKKKAANSKKGPHLRTDFSMSNSIAVVAPAK